MLEQGIKDPIVYLETMVKELNKKKEIKPIIDLFTVHKNFKFDLYDVLNSLIYSRIIKLLSKT